MFEHVFIVPQSNFVTLLSFFRFCQSSLFSSSNKIHLLWVNNGGAFPNFWYLSFFLSSLRIKVCESLWQNVFMSFSGFNYFPGKFQLKKNIYYDRFVMVSLWLLFHVFSFFLVKENKIPLEKMFSRKLSRSRKLAFNRKTTFKYLRNFKEIC